MTQEMEQDYRKPKIDLKEGCIKYDYGYKHDVELRALKQVIFEGTERDLIGMTVGYGMQIEGGIVVMTYPYRYG